MSMMDNEANRVVVYHTDFREKFNVEKLLWQLFGTAISFGIFAAMLNGLYWYVTGRNLYDSEESARRIVLQNHSGTYGQSLKPRDVFEPEDEADVIDLIAKAISSRKQIRPVGASLSSNFITQASEGIVNLRKMDAVVSVDTTNHTVQIQGGATLGNVTDVLRTKGMVLRSIPSHRNATVVGAVNTSSHGSHLHVGPIDNDVIALRLATSRDDPVVLPLTLDNKASLLRFARLGLGECGIVTEMTLQCTKRYKVEEKVEVCTVDEVKRNHPEWIGKYETLTYLWYPRTNVVVVTSTRRVHPFTPLRDYPSQDERKALGDMRRLLGMNDDIDDVNPTFVQLRHALYDYGPTGDPEWTRAIDDAELNYWSARRGFKRVGWVDDILQVKDDGPTFVVEYCAPVKDRDGNAGQDLDYALAMRDAIRKHPTDPTLNTPIEQTWSSASSSPMSPAFDHDPNTLFTWLTIRVLAPEQQLLGMKTQNHFNELRRILTDVGKPFDAIQTLATAVDRLDTREDVIDNYRKIRQFLDPRRLFAGPHVHHLLMDYSRRKLERQRQQHEKASEFTTGFVGKPSFPKWDL